MVDENAELVPIETLIARYENNKSEKNRSSLELCASRWRQTYNVRLMAAVEADSEATLGENFLLNLKITESERKKEEKNNSKKRKAEEENYKGDERKPKNMNDILGKKDVNEEKEEKEEKYNFAIFEGI
jgi:hypothetical protein